MPSGKIASWAYTEEYVDEAELFAAPQVMEHARERAAELGAAAPLPGEGAVLRLLAAASRARAVVEIGTGTGVGSLYLLAGMDPSGVLTTIDTEVENHRAAREAFEEAQIRPAAARTIAGDPLQVIGRLTDGAYDMVVFQADAREPLGLVDHASRLLRPGGLLVVTHALFHDQVADPADRRPIPKQARDVLRAISEREEWLPALLPSGDGVLAAVRR